MRVFTPTLRSAGRLRALLVAAIVMVLHTGASAVTGSPVYSTSGVVSNFRQHASTSSVLGTVESGTQYPELAANTSLDDYATLNTLISPLGATGIRLGLNGAGAAGDRAGVVVASASTNKNLVNINLLGAITLQTFDSNDNVLETRVVSAEVVRDLLAAGERPTQLEFVAKQAFAKIGISVSSVLSVSYKLRIYYAYAVPSLVQQQARGVLSQFSLTGSALAPYYGASTSNVGVVSVCAGAGVLNPGNAVDNSLTNFAQFSSLAGVGCAQSLSVKLAGGVAPGGFYAGFVIGTGGLLDLDALAGMRISTYRNGVATGESVSAAGLLELRALPDGKYQVSFPTTLPFDEVKIERVGLVSALDNLKLYYGFGVEPRAFEGTTHVLSDNNPTQAGFSDTYEVKQNSVVCVAINGSNCGVTNPAGAADNDPNTFATLAMPTAALSTVELKLGLNGTGVAGNRAGMVVGTGGGLLDATILDQFTLTTYDALGNVLESASGSSLLSLNLLPNGRQEISFLTTRDFKSVQLSATSGLSLLTSLPIYTAFADDRTGGLPLVITPLPVELTAFAAKWNNGAADLTWDTASEKNSSHFVVERATSAEASFEAVGQVAAAGNSNRTLTYKLRDAEAGTLRVSVLYYRLRQVDLDGTISYSPVASVAVGKLAAAPQLQVYPNPAIDAQAVLVRCPNLPATGGLVQAYSQLGQLVGQVPAVAAGEAVQMPLLKPGLYHVVLRDAAGQALATQRLVVGNR